MPVVVPAEAGAQRRSAANRQMTRSTQWIHAWLLLLPAWPATWQLWSNTLLLLTHTGALYMLLAARLWVPLHRQQQQAHLQRCRSCQMTQAVPQARWRSAFVLHRRVGT